MGTETREDQELKRAAPCDQVIEDVLERRWATRGKPLLRQAMERVREMQIRDDPIGFDEALIDLAAAALNTASVVRRNFPDILRRRRR